MKIKLLFVIAFALLLSSEAFSQSIKIGSNVGYYKSKDADEGALTAGGTLRLDLTSSIGVEGSVNYRAEKYYDGALEVTTIPVLATLLIHPLPIVYGLAGVGWYNVSYESPFGDETTSEFGYHIGAGAELELGSITLFGDLRYVLLNYEFDNVPGEADADFYIISAGLLFEL